MPQSTYESGSERFDAAMAQVRRDGEQAENAANRVAEQGRAAGEGMQQVAGNMKTALDKSIKDQPMATLAVAGIAGFVLGAIWKT